MAEPTTVAKGESTQARRIARGKADAEKIFPILAERFPGAIVEENREEVDPFLVVRPDRIVEVCTFCRESEDLRFDLLSLISTVDYPPGKGPAEEGGPGIIEVLYILDSTVHRHRLILKVRLPRDDPRVATVENIWRAADWHEREAYDLMGVVFEGHHNLSRILCAEDWEGHALRKDYQIPETYHGVKNIIY